MLARRKPLQPKSLFKQRKPLRARKRGVPVAVRLYRDRIAALGCLVCGGPATIHHVTAPITGGRVARSEQRIVPLCRAHHQHDYGKLSVERLGHAGFFRVHGIDLLAEAERLWREANG